MAKQAKWSPIWDDASLTRAQKVMLVKQAAYTAPSEPKSTKGGEFPHQQPAFKKKKQQEQAVEQEAA